MSEGFKLDVKGSEIIAHLDRRIALCNKEIGKLEEENAAIEKLPHMKHGSISSHPPVGVIKDLVDQQQFLIAHIDADKTYSLSYRELEALGLAPFAGGMPSLGTIGPFY